MSSPEPVSPVLPEVAAARQHALGDLPRRTAQRVPHKLAVVDGATRLTYAELEAYVERTASALVDAGFAKGDRLALLSRNSWQFVVLNFAAARAGVALVPVNFMLGADEIAFILDHSGATGFVVEEAFVPTAEAALASAARAQVRVRRVVSPSGTVPDGWEDLAGWLEHEGAPVDVQVGDDDPVRMMFTSGTESRPKGALLSSRALMWQYVSCVVDGSMSADDVELHTLPLYHCAQLDCFLGTDVYLGATNVILPGPDPTAVLRAIEEHRVTKFFAPPTVWIGLLRHPDLDSADLSSLRKAQYGASIMPVTVLERLRGRYPELGFYNCFGQSEIGPLATVLRPEEHDDHPGSAGRPVLFVDARVVDPMGKEVAAGEQGEIVYRSPQLMREYWNKPEATEEALRDGWFHSGDLVVADDQGFIEVVDRVKDVINTGGVLVASRQVEDAIFELDAVAEVAVVGMPDDKWIEAITAFVVPKGEITEEQVVDHVKGRLAPFKVPKAVHFVQELPKNTSGKILKRELRDR